MSANVIWLFLFALVVTNCIAQCESARSVRARWLAEITAGMLLVIICLVPLCMVFSIGLEFLGLS